MPSWPPGWRLDILDRATDAAAPVDEAAAEVYRLFAERERAFGVDPAVTIDYPDLADASPTGFLVNAPGYLTRRAQALRAGGAPVTRTVLLTTYSERVHAALTGAGYRFTPIDMPAGPDHTGVFARDVGEAGQGGAGRTLYVEAVNEADEKIRPSFALRLFDEHGQLAGGACGVVHARDGRKYAWLSTLSVRAEVVAGTGTALAQALMAHLRAQQVHVLHLGTQTADAFYRKLGFATTLTVLPALRFRLAADGRRMVHSLVMMEKSL